MPDAQQPASEALTAERTRLEQAERDLDEREQRARDHTGSTSDSERSQLAELAAERDDLATQWDALADASDDEGRRRDLLSLGRDKRSADRDVAARRHGADRDPAFANRWMSAIDRDDSGGDRADSVDDRRNSGSARRHAADARTRAATDRKDSTDALQDAVAQTEQLTADKAEMLSRVRHELRTPLTAILGYAELLSDSELDEVQSGDLHQVRTAGRHLQQLVEDVLTLTPLTSGQPSVADDPVALSRVVQEAIDLLLPTSQAARVPVLRVADLPDVVVRADHGRLRQVLVSVLTNAVQYSTPDSTVTVTWQHGADQAQLIVQDTGQGMSAAQVAAAVRPFERLDAEQRGIPGSGLGLTVASSLVAAMHGTLRIDSAVGKGTTVTITLATDTHPDAGLG